MPYLTSGLGIGVWFACNVKRKDKKVDLLLVWYTYLLMTAHSMRCLITCIPCKTFGCWILNMYILWYEFFLFNILLYLRQWSYLRNQLIRSLLFFSLPMGLLRMREIYAILRKAMSQVGNWFEHLAYILLA